MANSSVLITQGTQTSVAGDSVNGTQYQTVKLDIGASGVSTPFVGSIPNVGSMTNLGSVSNIGTVPGVGSVTNLGSVSNVGSIFGIGGTVQVQGASTGTFNNIATGTVNSVGSLTTVGTVLGIGGTVNVNGATVGTTNQIAGGTIISGSPDAGNPVKVGAVYNGTAPTFASGARSDLQSDINGNLKATLATLIAGEMLAVGTTGVLRVENQFTGSYLSAAGTYTLSTGTGVCHLLSLGSTTAAAGTLYNSQGTSGTVLWSHKASVVEQSFLLDIAYTNGLTYACPGTPQITVSFR